MDVGCQQMNVIQCLLSCLAERGKYYAFLSRAIRASLLEKRCWQRPVTRKLMHLFLLKSSCYGINHVIMPSGWRSPTWSQIQEHKFSDFPEKCDWLHGDVHLFAVLICAGTKLESLMESMRGEIATQPPVEGSFAPRRGDICIAKFADGEW